MVLTLLFLMGTFAFIVCQECLVYSANFIRGEVLAWIIVRILNVHHDTGAADTAWLVASDAGFEAAKQRYQSLWGQIANTFKDYGERLLFESYNEMLDPYDSWCFASFATPNRYDSAVATSAYNGINSYAKLFAETVRATGGTTGGTAGGAAARLVLEALVGIELLLRSGENEFLAALTANQSLVFKHGYNPP